MRAMLLKPIEGLEVGQIYDLIEQRGGYLTWRNITTNEEIEYIYNGGYKTFFNYWFIFQELPEQLKEQIRDAIEENAGATVCIPSIEEQEEMADNALNAVCAVLEGEQ